MSRVPGVSQTTLWFSYILNSSVFSLYNTKGNPLPIQIIFFEAVKSIYKQAKSNFWVAKKVRKQGFYKERERVCEVLCDALSNAATSSCFLLQKATAHLR